MEYLLMNKNKEVLSFEYDLETHTIVKILDVLNGDYAPLGIIEYKNGISKKAFNDWWKDRSIPASRSKFKEILEVMDISSSVELLEKCYGLSLSDQYWVKEIDSTATWKDVNFFENDFSEDMGRLLMGEIEYSKDLNIFSPDNSSDGNLKKKWKIMNGKRFLIKGGNQFTNQEPFNEVIATKLYERLLNPEDYVPYHLLEENGNIYSSCQTMVKTNEELVSAYYIDKTKKLRGSDSLYEHYIEACEELGIPNVREQVNKMIVCDFILGNYDRHYRNFGAIRNIDTLEWERISPIYDSGSSLYADTPTLHIGNSFKAKPFKTDMYQQLKLVDDLSWFKPQALEGFVEEVYSILSLNPLMEAGRIEKICQFVSSTIQKVIDYQDELEEDYQEEQGWCIE